MKSFRQHVLQLRKDKHRLASVMVFHLSEIDRIGKNAGNRPTTDAEAIAYLKSAVKKLKDYDFADAEELQMLQSFLPQMASKQEIQTFLNTLNTNNKGEIMAAVKQHFGAAVDMRVVAGMV